MENPAFTRVSLSDVRVIMTIMHVAVEELLHQAATGWIPVLKYLLSGACGHLWPCPVMPDIKCRSFPKTRLQWCLPGIESPLHLPSRGGGMRLTGPIGGEILLTRGHQDRGKD
jgi:hypothetical protein